MASSLTLGNLLASRPLYHSFGQPTRFISSNQEVEDRPSNLASRVVVPSSPTANLISQRALFLYGGGPGLARQWSKTKATKPINLSILTSGRGDLEEEEEEEEEEELHVTVGIEHKSGPRSASRSVWLKESNGGLTNMLEDNGINVGERGVLVSLSHEIGCQPKGVWGRYNKYGKLYVYIEMPAGVGGEEVEVSVEENTVDIQANPPLETIGDTEIDVNERCTLRIDLPEKRFDALSVIATLEPGMLAIHLPRGVDNIQADKRKKPWTFIGNMKRFFLKAY